MKISRKPVPRLQIEPSSPFMASSDLLKSPKTAPVGLGFMNGSSEIEDAISESPELESEHNNFSSSTIALSSTASESTRQNTSTPQSSAGSYKEGDGFITVTSPSPEVDTEIKEEEEDDGNEIEEADYGKVAQKLYDGVYDQLNPDEYARWLGSEGSVQECVRKAYMDLFEWRALSILMALRDLCNRIYMKGESQQLNRVIESFSQAWVDKNPNHGFYDTNVVYTIAYALILLNTDIYAADHTVSKKMTKSAFVNNTMETIKGHMNAEKQALHAAKTLPHSVSPRASFDESSTTNNTPTNNQPTHRPKRSSISFNNSGSQQQHDTTSMVNECSCKPFTKEWEFQLEMILKVFYSSVSKEALKLHIVENSSGTPSSNIYGSQHQQQPQQAAVSTAPSLRSSIMGNGGGGSILGRLNKFRGSNRNFENQSRLSTFGGLDRSGDSIRRDSLNSTFSFESNFSAFGGSRHAVGFAGLLWNSMIKEEGADESFGDFEKIEQELKKEVELELLGAPWTKEGLLKYRPYIDPNTGKKSKKKDWTQVFMVVQRGQLKMFNFDTSGNSKSSNNGPVNGVVGAGNWMENANLVDGFHLCHTMAQELPPPKKAKGFEALWSLTLPHRGLLVFQAGTAEIAQEFVYTCNYWAGRLSKEPFEEAVSSMEFGWGVPLEKDTNEQQPNPVPQRSPRGSANRGPTPGDKLVIKEWRPTGHSLVVSDLDEDKQIASLKAYINRAEEMLTEHNALRGRISQSFTPGSPNWTRAHSNWEKKSQYLLQQVIRYKTYVENLERGASEKKEKLASSDENNKDRKASIVTETGPNTINNDTDSSASVVTARYEDSSGNESSNNKQTTLEANLESDERDCPNLAPNDASYSPKWINN